MYFTECLHLHCIFSGTVQTGITGTVQTEITGTVETGMVVQFGPKYSNYPERGSNLDSKPATKIYRAL